jgi:stage II sporulation protein AB (anti-sigma F factor)
MNKLNEMKLRVLSRPVNESFVRSAVSAFCVQANPSLSIIEDIKTAVSEAVTNCIVHAYDNDDEKFIDVEAILYENSVEIVIKDYGKGILNLNLAMQPFYTTKPQEERSGMGFTIMQSFMSSLNVESSDKGTIVKMTKSFAEV